ncbi:MULTISPECIES: hypothetical protein [Pedobacter]|uniref:hypothetical protein n=1 Tax=Pedobacter TaxID=84567 RepID=UPI00122A9AC0|nr:MULTISPECIES: hypothetical protein [Pedobacter]RZL20593.1 MAG: hypothetical protein EOO96_24870 [Pedobacter sp.]
MNNKLKIGICFLLLTWLFTGIKCDDEFNEHSMFLKYRPTFQYYFKSPLGMQDMPANYPADLFEDQAIYDEFINEKHWSDNDFLETSICGILVLGLLYFLTAGLIKQFKYDK